MKTVRAILYLLLFVAGGVALAWFLYGLVSSNLDNNSSVTNTDVQNNITTTTTAEPEPSGAAVISDVENETPGQTSPTSTTVTTISPTGEQLAYLTAIGTVQSTGVATLYPLTSGAVKKVNITEGDFVHEGDVLMELTGSNQSDHLSETQLKIAETTLANAKISLDNLKATSAQSIKTASLQLQSAKHQTDALTYDLGVIEQNQTALGDSLDLLYDSYNSTVEKLDRDEQKTMGDIDDLIYTLNAAQDDWSSTKRQLNDTNDQIDVLQASMEANAANNQAPADQESNDPTAAEYAAKIAADQAEQLAALQATAAKLQTALDAQNEGIDALYKAIDQAKYGLNSAQNGATLTENQVRGQIVQSESQAQVLDLTLESTKTKLGYTGDSSDALKLAEQAYEATKTQLDAAVENAASSVKLAELNVAVAKSQTDALAIKAPFDGVVTSLPFYAGQNVNPQLAVAEVLSPKTFELQVGVDPKTADRISTSAPAIIELAGRQIEVPIKSIALKVDAQTKLVNVKLALPNIFFKLNQNLKVQIPLSTAPITPTTGTDDSDTSAARFVPLDAVIIGTESQFVYVNDNGKAKKVEVKIGQISGDQIEVLSGLSADSEVIVKGAKNLTDGQDISVTKN